MELTRQELLSAYERMRLIRAVSDLPAFLVRDLTADGRARWPSVAALGSEAGLIGLGWVLSAGDRLCTSLRHPAVALALGETPFEVAADLLGRPVDLPTRTDLKALARRGEALAADRYLSGISPAHMIGTALVSRPNAPDAVTVALVDPEADQDAPLWDAVMAARALALPILFVVVRQGPEGRPGDAPGRPPEASSPFALRAQSCGVCVRTARAHDLFSVFPSARDVLDAVRRDGTPHALELVHLGEDPLISFRTKTVSAGYFDVARLDGIDREIERLMRALTQTEPGGGESPVLREIRP